VTRGQGVEAKAKAKAKATIFCPRAVFKVEDSRRGPYPFNGLQPMATTSLPIKQGGLWGYDAFFSGVRTAEVKEYMYPHWVALTDEVTSIICTSDNYMTLPMDGQIIASNVITNYKLLSGKAI